MFADLSIDIREIEDISKSKEAPTLDLMVLAQKINRIAINIKKSWHKLPVEEREKLQKLAYQLTEPRQGLDGLFSQFLSRIRLIIIVATGQTDALIAYSQAFDLLIDNIFDAIERSDSIYEETLSETLDELIADPESGKVLQAGETRGWLRSLSDKALNQI